MKIYSQKTVESETMQKELIYKYEKRHETKTKSKHSDSIYNQKHIRSQLKKIEYSEKKRSLYRLT